MAAARRAAASANPPPTSGWGLPWVTSLQGHGGTGLGQPQAVSTATAQEMSVSQADQAGDCQTDPHTATRPSPAVCLARSAHSNQPTPGPHTATSPSSCRLPRSLSLAGDDGIKEPLQQAHRGERLGHLQAGPSSSGVHTSRLGRSWPKVQAATSGAHACFCRSRPLQR